MSWLDLENKVIIVTGAASGIGAAIASELKQQGAKVISADLNIEKLDDPDAIQCDVTKVESVKAMVAKVVETYGRIDGLVNNAGINFPRLLVDKYGKNADYELSETSFSKMVDVNIKGLFQCAQEVARQMLHQEGGVIVNVSSEAGKEGSSGQSLYSATKGACDSFTRSWAKELGDKNIRVVAIAPGILEATGLRSPAYNEALAYTRGTVVDKLSTDYSKTIPLGREGKLTEVADLVSFLLSNRASYITGTTINITGGKSRG